MSKRKDRERAKSGNPHVTTKEPLMGRRYVCAYCHDYGTLVKVGDFYFHQNCPKVIKPFKKAKVTTEEVIPS